MQSPSTLLQWECDETCSRQICRPPQSWSERLRALKNVPPLLGMVWRTSPSLCVATLALRAISALFPLATLWVSKLIIDLVVRAIRGDHSHSGEVWKLLILELLLAVAADTTGRFISLVDSLLGDRFTNTVSVRLMEHANSLDLLSFEDPVFYDKMERARRQTTSRLGMLASWPEWTAVAHATLDAVHRGLFLPLATGFADRSNYSRLFRGDPVRGPELFHALPVHAERRELDYLRYLGASNESAKEVRIFGLGKYLVERSRALFERFYAENRQLAIKRATQGTLLNLIPTGGYYGAYAFILMKALQGLISVGDLTLIVGAFSRSRSIMESLVSGLVGISEQALFIKDLFEFFETNPTVVSRPGALPAPRPIRDGFEFENVSFRYLGSNRKVLDNVSFRFQRGERIALVGENGAGKTTLVKLLARLYDPSEGRILLDGIDLRDFDVYDLRHEIGVIFQDYMRYDMKAGENIGIGRIDELTNEVRIANAAEKSLAAGVIGETPRSSTVKCLAAVSRVALTFPPVSGRKSRSHGPTCATPRS